ncbi:MAG: fused MFS/spermidine synthase [Gemmatimonadota bacterium]
MTSDAPGARRALFGSLFFVSGAAGLVYELIWVRELYQFFGSTIHSVTTVVAAYMGGLGLGAYVMGRRADRHPNPARLYGILELAIGAFGIASPFVFRGVGAAYLGLARALEPGLWTATAIKFAFAFVVLLIPTFLMGGTLPILTRAFAGARTEHLRRELGLFYGLNTVGGVAGCMLAGYFLIEYVGLRQSLFATGLVNLALGAAVMALTRGAPAAAYAPDDDGTAEPAYASPSAPWGADAATRRLAIWLIAITAFASLLYEIAWTRVLVLVVGSSTYAFTTILACFLLGIGLGSLVAIGRGRPPRDLLIRSALIQSAIAVLAALLFPFFRALPVYIVGTLQVTFLSPTELLVLHGLAIAVVVVPPAVGMGLSFPILAELAAERTGTTGRESGRAYLANTLGSIVGAVVTGFLLVHLIGSERTLEIGVAVNVGAAAVMAWWLYRERATGGTPLPMERLPLVMGALALVIALATPSWSRRLLDRGPAIYGKEAIGRRDLRNFLRGLGAEQLVFDEGWNAAISVWRNGGATWLKSNGKSDASSVADMNTQVMVGLLPAIAHPAPRRVFVLGFGSGATLRTVADVPGVESIDLVEIERAVLDAAPQFDLINRDVLHDPRVNVIEDDARSTLQLAREPYDVIVAEPTNPWIAGVAALFTRDFFRVVNAHLADDGVFSQWVQTYRVPQGVISVVVANLRAVFPHVEVWYSNPSDLVLLASRRPIRWSEARLAALMAPGTPLARSFHDWLEIDRPSQLLGRFLLGERGTALLAGAARFQHSDNRPSLEFVAARGLLGTTSVGVTFDSLLGIKAAAGDSLPDLADWRLSPGEWQAAYGRALPAENRFALSYAEEALRLAPRDAERRGAVGRVLFGRDQFRDALTYVLPALRERPDDPRLLLIAGIATAAGRDLTGARTYLERSRAAGGDSVYATSILAETAAGEGDYRRAAAEALRALRGLNPTIATPFPGSLENAVRKLAFEAPPEVAAPVLDAAVELRPSWDLGYHGGARVYARWGGEHCRRAAELVEQLPRFGWTEKEAVSLLRPCARR